MKLLDDRVDGALLVATAPQAVADLALGSGTIGEKVQGRFGGAGNLIGRQQGLDAAFVEEIADLQPFLRDEIGRQGEGVCAIQADADASWIAARRLEIADLTRSLRGSIRLVFSLLLVFSRIAHRAGRSVQYGAGSGLEPAAQAGQSPLR
jgi:hypothetical protein